MNLMQKGNLIPMDQLPALTNSGFSPGMIAVVISEKKYRSI